MSSKPNLSHIRFQLSGVPCQAVPGEYRAADVVFLGAGGAALAFLDPEHLLALAVVLLDFPADAAEVLDSDGGILGQVVGGGIFPSGWSPQPGTV
jgi:hypothetical protein